MRVVVVVTGCGCGREPPVQEAELDAVAGVYDLTPGQAILADSVTVAGDDGERNSP